ncbi:MAG TPA: CheR family methyltransferase [Stellaceae bacterium]|nr:CheR family methyltransferase [Stellaceae bacterium]
MAADQFPVVGVGASAGGVEALQAFFQPMPADPGMTFIVITHIGEGYESALPQILERSTTLPIVAVREGERIAANHIYIVTSNAVAAVRRGRLRLRRHVSSPRSNTIDALLASLAEEYGDAAVGVILSGGGHDGTLGARAIQEAGGLTIAQTADHGAPRYPDMPTNAIASGAVDLQIPVAEMAQRLVEYVQRRGTLEGRAARHDRVERERVDKVRQEICQILRDQIGHDFSAYKERTFLRRVERRMQVLTVREVEEYVERLRSDHEEATNLFHDLLIGVTAFFRDSEAFQALADKIIPTLFEGKGASDTIRVWIPGCATGEEVYSLAILLLEHMDSLRARPKVACFATDIDEPAVAVARAARYPVAMLQNVSPERLDRFFVGNGTSYALTKEVRDLCIFSSHSVIRDPPFSRVDLISCRNLLIYLDKDLQRQLIPVFHYALRPAGYLFLGISESLTEYAQLFTTIDKQYRIFQRREHLSVRPRLPLVVPQAERQLGLLAHHPAPRSEAALPLRHIIDSRVIEQFSPAHVVVTRDGDAVHFSTRTGKYLETPPGIPNRSIVTMARRGLRPDLRTALAEVVETRRPVHRTGVRVEFEGRVQIVDLTVEPLLDHTNEPLFLIVFSDVGAAFTPDQLLPVLAEERGGSAAQLEGELHEARERLQSMVEEYETAIEELKSANEELVSINEELQSSNEELETSREESQSINEELSTVNSELQGKIEELDRANDNLRNLFEGTGIAIAFLDKQLVIRSFTPAIKNIFSLMDVDRGRPLTDIVSELGDLDLRAEVEPVLANAQPRERRVVRRDGTIHYLMRVLPYRTAENALDGVLVTFTDITRITEIEEYQRELSQRIEAMLQTAVQIVERSQETTAAPETMLDRLRTLGDIHRLVAAAKWGEVALIDLAARELGNYGIGRDGRVTVEGPAVRLRAPAAVNLGLALHELAVNAASRGALSVPQGRVHLNWEVVEAETPAARLVIRWQETGGPPVRPPADKDYGSELITVGLKAAIGASGSFDFAGARLTADLVLPLSSKLILLLGSSATPGEQN